MKKSDLKPGLHVAYARGNELFSPYGDHGHASQVIVLGTDWDSGYRSWGYGSQSVPKKDVGSEYRKVLVLKFEGRAEERPKEDPAYTEDDALKFFASAKSQAYRSAEYDESLRPPKGWNLVFANLSQLKMPWEQYEKELAEHRAARAKAKAAAAIAETQRKQQVAMISDELETFGLPRLSDYAKNVTLSFEQYHQLVDRTGRD